jgi:hypothetical protein
MWHRLPSLGISDRITKWQIVYRQCYNRIERPEMPGLTADWKRSWGRALRELDTAKFALLVSEAEADMFHRYQVIADSPDHSDERVQMADALDHLHAVKVERLKWRPSQI